jgi:hypothetical protein
LDIIDFSPTIEEIQMENQAYIEERKTIDEHLHHDNAVLQEKVNSLQWLVDGMTQSNRSLRAQFCLLVYLL